MMRWVSPLDELAVEVMVPCEPDVMFPVLGLLRFTQFMTLVISARNWNTIPCPNLTSRSRPASICLRPGPMMVPRLTLPSAPPGPMPKPGPLRMYDIPAAWAAAIFVLSAATYVLLNHCVSTLVELWPAAPHTRQRCGSNLNGTPVELGRLLPFESKFRLDPDATVFGRPAWK